MKQSILVFIHPDLCRDEILEINFAVYNLVSHWRAIRKLKYKKLVKWMRRNRIP